MHYQLLIEDLLNRNYESEWFEFKVNWFEPEKLGQYISALSNSARVLDSDFGYLIWGIEDKTHNVVGTNIDFNIHVNNEPLEHYLLRYLTPNINIKFIETNFQNKRIVILEVPAANKIPTSFKNIRYVRIGSSTECLLRYPEKEAEIWNHLNYKTDTIDNMESEYQNLTFTSLINYYGSLGINLNLLTFKENLGLLTKDGKYNILAQILSDNSHINVRVAIFNGTTKSDKLYSVKEFGNMCMLLSLEKILDFGDTFNIPKADETNRLLLRNELNLFDFSSFREAIINAFVHNDWKTLNAPQITFFSDRVEILSEGQLSPRLNMDDFYRGKSEPTNKRLSDIFIQLHISERTGRGVPIIVDNYSKNAFCFNNYNLIVSICYKYKIDFSNSNNNTDINLSFIQRSILELIRINPSITKNDMMAKINVSRTTIHNNLLELQRNNIIKRSGTNRKGKWVIFNNDKE